MRILSIGSDVSIFDPDSNFRNRIKLYHSYHDIDTLVLGAGRRRSTKLAGNLVEQPGGRNRVFAFVKTFYSALRLTRRHRYDLVLTQDVLYAGLVGFVVARLRNLPLVTQLHGDYLDNREWFESGIGTFNRVMNPIGRYVLRHSDGVRGVSERIRQRTISRFGVSPEKIISSPIGTNASFFSKGLEAREGILLFVGRLLPEKNPHLFVESVAEVMRTHGDSIRAVLVGGGPLERDLRWLVKTRSLERRFEFVGQGDHEDLARWYQRAKCLVHTADWEGWGIPMIEAIASGCPVVTTDTGAAGEAIRDRETGLVVPVNDPDAIVRAICLLLDDQQLWHQLSENGVLEAERWSFEQLTKRTMEFYGSFEKTA